MTYNIGFYCKKCGPMKTAQKKTIKGTQYNVCPECSNLVQHWERPLNQRLGHCPNCGNASFTLAMGKNKLKGIMLRKCKECDQVENPDTGEVFKQGRSV